MRLDALSPITNHLMPKLAEHLAHAKRLKNTLQFLCEKHDNHSEWIAVTAFYRALHLSESLLVKGNIPHDRSHVGREQALKRTKSTSHIWIHYRPLWEASNISRYLAYQGTEYSSFATYLDPDKVVSELVNYRLREIEKSVANQLSMDPNDL